MIGDRLDQRRVVLRNHRECVARFVGDPAVGECELVVANLLVRACP
ncbi:Uncharacterised protein [Mycobacteroides abscessus subsp. abscessus]|nr:Uncharacterised protein [Mycobacteroides abscessus subsp. abscessus]